MSVRGQSFHVRRLGLCVTTIVATPRAGPSAAQGLNHTIWYFKNRRFFFNRLFKNHSTYFSASS